LIDKKASKNKKKIECGLSAQGFSATAILLLLFTTVTMPYEELASYKTLSETFSYRRVVSVNEGK
jgi:hypothetical protein